MNVKKIGNKKIEKKYNAGIGKSEKRNICVAAIGEKTRVMEN
jgi:hypothetical protein